MIKYFKPIVDNNITYSIDMLRFDFELSFDLQKELSLIIENLRYKFFSSNKAFSFKNLFIVYVDYESFKIGLGLNSLSAVKMNARKCFVEFNPNKVGSSSELARILGYIRGRSKLFLNHYDLAIDLPCARSFVSVVKDRRDYKRFVYSNSSSNITEYLGNSNETGRLKIYNKRIESELDYDLTRIEFSFCYPDYSAFSLKFPKVYFLKTLDLLQYSKLSGTDRVLVELILQSSDPLFYFKSLSRDKQKKLKPYIMCDNSLVEVPYFVFKNLMSVVEHFQ